MDPMSRAGWWLAGAGTLVLARSAVELAEPNFWDPQTALDYTAASLTTVAWSALGIALIFWWRAVPAHRARWVLFAAGVGSVVGALGNLIEDVIGLGFGVWMFVIGMPTGGLGMFVAAVILLATRSPIRWSGAFLLVYLAGLALPDQGGHFIGGAALIALGLWLRRRTELPEIA